MIHMYNTNDDILVAKKSDYHKNSTCNEYFIVPKEEWLSEDDGIKTFHLFLTKIEGDRIYLYLVQGEYPVISEELPLSRRVEYIEVTI